MSHAGGFPSAGNGHCLSYSSWGGSQDERLHASTCKLLTALHPMLSPAPEQHCAFPMLASYATRVLESCLQHLGFTPLTDTIGGNVASARPLVLVVTCWTLAAAVKSTIRRLTS